MNRTKLTLALALALPGTCALAQGVDTGVSWSYFDFGVQQVSPDNDSLDNGTGFGVRGSGAINANWHVFLGWNRTPIEGLGPITTPGGSAIAGVDDDVDRYNIGIGYNFPVAAQTDLFTRVGYERIGSTDFSVLSSIAPPGTLPTSVKLDSNDGYSIEVGVRSAFSPRFEAGVSARYIAFDDPDVTFNDGTITVPGLVDDSSTSLLLYGQYKFGNGWGVIAEGDFNSEYTSAFVGARLSY